MSTEDNPVLKCTLKMEWLNSQGLTTRHFNSKCAVLKLLRNGAKQMFIEVSGEKTAPIRQQLKGISVHKKFMSEGKASIKFQDDRCTMFLSNAPPAKLFEFLKTIFVKMTGGVKEASNTPLRNQVLTGKLHKFDEISPVTEMELQKAKKRALGKSTDTTPSPNKKRKLGENSKIGTAKKLYSSSPVPNEPLDIEQKEVLDACLSGFNIFFTGSAGTGKSFLLRKIIGALPPDVTVATASTGVAACHIGGITLHQFAGIGMGKSSLERSIELASKPVAASMWKKCKHLIIDEVSMVDADFFEKIEQVARIIRKNEKPFGGIQVILCGDFFQLPPVDRERKSVKFCFMTKAWNSVVQRFFELKQVHRQNEIDFINLLNEVRIGKVSLDVQKKLENTAKQQIESDGILATRLCSHTQDVDIINETKLKELNGESKIFEAQDSDPGHSNNLDSQTNVPKRLELKIGAQVMLLKNINISKGLVNGARGVVKEFRDDLPVVKFRNIEYLARLEKWVIKTSNGGTPSRKQVPLRLAWAFSIHKSQGLTLDCVEMSLGRVFEAGQAYVALSRAQSIKTLRVLDFKASQVWAHPDVLVFYKDLKEKIDMCRYIPLGDIAKKKKTMSKNGTMKNLTKSILGKPLVNIS